MWPISALVVAALGTGAMVDHSGREHEQAGGHDCSAFDDDTGCLLELNASEGRNHIDLAAAKRRGQAKLRDPVAEGTEWRARFARAYCDTWGEVDFPELEVANATGALQRRLRHRLGAIRRNNSKRVVLVHVQQFTDGVGAGFKRAVQVVAAGLHVGFDAVGLHMVHTTSNYYARTNQSHPGMIRLGGPNTEVDHDAEPQPDWNQARWGRLSCHGGFSIPQSCWRFDLLRDLLGQSPAPEDRTLLWGASWLDLDQVAGVGVLSVRSWQDQRRSLNCLAFRPIKHLQANNMVLGMRGPQDRALPVAAWELLRHANFSTTPLAHQVVRSARAFASPPAEDAAPPPFHRPAKCGFGSRRAERDRDVHVAMHLRRGDLGDRFAYSLSQQMPGGRFGRFLCVLAGALGITAAGSARRRLVLHVYTQTPGGGSRADLRASKPLNFGFGPQAGDDAAPRYHTLGTLRPAPPCNTVSNQVHWVTNNSPREVGLCMARADVLIASLSSLSWIPAVVNKGVVLFPSVPPGKENSLGANPHDLRAQHLDWADNWFMAEDLLTSNATVAAVRAHYRSQHLVD